MAFAQLNYDATAKRLKTEFLSKLRSGEFDKFSEKLGFCSGVNYTFRNDYICLMALCDRSWKIVM